MCRIRLLILVIALSSTTWSSCEAVGSFQKPEPHRVLVTAGVAPSLPSISMPNVTARDLVGGCGRGRVRDPQSHGCRGPGDIR
jgi:hypothetical protein